MEHSDRGNQRDWSLEGSDARKEAKSVSEEPSFSSPESPFPATSLLSRTLSSLWL